jgi:hypothetical protein
MSTKKRWPAPHPRKGAALSRADIEARYGLTYNIVNVWRKRTRDGRDVEVPFPDQNGEAVPSDGRQMMVPYWWQATVEEYLQAKGILA